MRPAVYFWGLFLGSIFWVYFLGLFLEIGAAKGFVPLYSEISIRPQAQKEGKDIREAQGGCQCLQGYVFSI